MELLTKALTALLSSQPALLEMVPIMGHIQGFLKNLSSKRDKVSKSSLLILKELSRNKQCVSSIIGYQNSLKQIMAGMRFDPEVIPIACETLNRLFVTDSDSLVHQAIECDLVTQLLSILDSSSASGLTANTKAIIVEVLKNMSQNVTYGEQVDVMLNKSSVWSEFKDQKHDLFISNQPTNYISEYHLMSNWIY